MCEYIDLYWMNLMDWLEILVEHVVMPTVQRVSSLQEDICHVRLTDDTADEPLAILLHLEQKNVA